MQFFTTIGPEKVGRVFVTGSWDDDEFIVESVIPGELGAPAVELIDYLHEEYRQEIEVAAHEAARVQEAQQQEDAAEEASYWLEAA